MSFNHAATRLAVSSSNRTIHIFDVSAGGGGGGGGVERGRSTRSPNSSPTQGSGSITKGNQGQEQDAESDNTAGGGGGGSKKTTLRRGASGRGGDAGAASSSGGVGGSGGGATAGGGLASSFRSVVAMLPNKVTKRVQDYVDSNRSFASVRLRGSAGRSICALVPAGDVGGWMGRGRAQAGERESGGGRAREGSEHEEEEEEEGEVLLVVTNEGILYSYVVDTVAGGECRLEQASSLLMDPAASQEIGSELFVPERRAPPVLAGQS